MGKKIIFVTPTVLVSYGGTEVWCINIANELSNRKYNVEVITSNFKPDKIRISHK